MRLTKLDHIPLYLLGTILFVVAPFFFWGGPGYHAARSHQAFWDLGHIFFFLVFSLWLQRSQHNKKTLSHPFFFFIVCFVLVLVLGSSIELLQMLKDNRSPDLGDVFRNQLGCLVAFAFLIEPSFLPTRRIRQLFCIAVILLLMLAFWPFTRAVIDERIATHQFPVLADFETPFERHRWVEVQQLQEETVIVRHGGKSARVQLSTNKYSGVALFHFPHDWRGYQTLHCSVYNPQQTPLVLNSRIHDSHHKKYGNEFHDRFNQQFTLEPGWNDLSISLDKVKAAPRGRKMDMEHIEGFGLFVIQLLQPQVLYLDHVYLDQ